MQNGTDSHQKSFQRKVWIVTGIVALVVVVLWILKAVFNVILLIFAGALLALYFQGLGGLIHRKLHVPRKWSVLVAVIFSLILLALFFWLAGSKIGQQVQQLSQTLPGTIDNVRQQMQQSTFGREVLERATSGGNMKKLSSTIQSFFSSTFGLLGDLYVVLFLGFFFTASPRVYINGFVKLFPAPARDRSREVMHETGSTLMQWLKGKLFAMLVVAVLTIAGLLVIGVPMAFTLGLIAGILSFVPNFGPIIALIPAVLVGFMQSPVTALWVLALYVGVQAVESNIITPQVQKRLIEIPPALIIMAQLFMGLLTGGWGLVLATPLVAILMVVLQELWISRQEQPEGT